MSQINPRPTLSLVALVRDESAGLRRLLTWHRDLYDEAVVVDTGSRDDSLSVAAELGATVSHFRWCDDFSAARNHGLALAAGRWILVLDCDEVIAREDFASVRSLLDGPPAGWLLRQWNYCRELSDPRWRPLPATAPLAPPSATGYVDNPTCRIFPGQPAIRYEGSVHELPDGSLRAAGLPLLNSEVAVHHFGHLVSPELAAAKNTRYAKLLRAKLKANPSDTRARYEMAVQLLAEDRADLALRLLQRAVRENPQHPDTHRSLLLIGQLLVREGRAADALAPVETAVRTWPALKEGWVDAARLHSLLGHREAAGRYVQQGHQLFPADPVWRELAVQEIGALVDN